MRQEERHRRIRRVKRLLRPLPRRANVHRYPVLSLFAETARKRSYLWSFRIHHAVRAFYAGWILTLLPVYGLQILIGFLLAVALRANLMILVGLQLVTNPLTVGPIWYLTYRLGEAILSVFGSEGSELISETVVAAREMEVGFFGTIRMLMDRVGELESVEVMELVGRLLTSVSVGGIVLGLFFGFVSSRIYTALAHSARKHHIPILERIDKPEGEETATATEDMDSIIEETTKS